MITRRIPNPLNLVLPVVLLALALLVAPTASGRAQPATLTYGNATYTAPPSCETLTVPRVNPDVPVRVCAIVRRPEGGGGLHVLTLFTADGTLVDIDLTAYGYQDCFGADPWLSTFSGTIKAFTNCKPPDAANGNDRVFFPVDSGIEARP
jgi:hypothetical protein